MVTRTSFYGDSTAYEEIVEAGASATAAAASAAAALVSETAADASADAAAASAVSAAASAVTAAAQASAASGSASTATTQASNASTSASTATTQASNAAASALAADASADAALISETAADASADAAAASATAAAASYDAFDDRYLGSKASDPTLDNDGNALATGALYFNTASNALKVYNGSSWITYSGASGLTNVSDDTSPTLGGSLDAGGFDITNIDDMSFNSGAVVTFGTGTITNNSGNDTVEFSGYSNGLWALDGKIVTQNGSLVSIHNGAGNAALEVYDTTDGGFSWFSQDGVTYLGRLNTSGVWTENLMTIGTNDAVSFGGTVTLTSPAITTPTGIVKGDVGLGNVDNTSDTNKPVSTAQQTALNLKANIASPTFTGTITLPGLGTNQIFVGGSDTASYAGYNVTLKGHFGIGLTDYTDTCRGYYDFRTGTWDVKGAYKIDGVSIFASPALTGTPTAPTAAADTNTTQVATTAHVFAERTNTATLTNKTLTSPTITNPSMSGAMTHSGNLYLTGATQAIEHGTVGTANMPYYDWHSSASSTDYDFRFQAASGTASLGEGTMTFTGAAFLFTGGAASDLRANTSQRVLTSTNVWSAAAEVTLTDAATIAVDMSTFINAVVTPTTNRTMGNPTNEKVGQSGYIRVVTGGYTMSWGTDWEFAGGVAPTLTGTSIVFYTVIAADRIVASALSNVS